MRPMLSEEIVNIFKVNMAGRVMAPQKGSLPTLEPLNMLCYMTRSNYGTSGIKLLINRPWDTEINLGYLGGPIECNQKDS